MAAGPRQLRSARVGAQQHCQMDAFQRALRGRGDIARQLQRLGRQVQRGDQQAPVGAGPALGQKLRLAAEGLVFGRGQRGDVAADLNAEAGASHAALLLLRGHPRHCR